MVFAKKKYHDIAKGFNEEVFMGEDHMYARNLTRNGAKYGLIRSKPILFDIRRFEKEGVLKVTYKWYYMLWEFIFHGSFKKKIIDYDFGNY